ncbi:MAG: phosphoglycerate dehydrogenase [Myxococcota bacterium]|nr:phosphoglycerate dehydrogenase [Myxococcota bacterium]
MAGIVAWSTSSFGKESARPLELLRSAGYEVRGNPHGRTLTTDEAKAHLDGVIGLVAGTEKLTGDLLRALPGLRCVSRVGVGMDSIDHVAAKECGIAVVNTPDAHVDAVAELTLAGLLALLRKIPVSDASIRNGGFEKPMGRLLGGKTIGLVGCGRVGRRFAELVAGFGVTVLGHDPHVAAAPANISQVSLDELVAKADVVSLHLPYSVAAKHLLGAEQFARMKKDTVIVNTSRGGLIDEPALLAFLEANPKAGAYLDCFEKEPYSGPLAKLSNVVLTAHIGSYAREARVRMELEAVENLLRILNPS